MRLLTASLLFAGLLGGCGEPLGGLTISGLERGGPCTPGGEKLQGFIPIEVQASDGTLTTVTVTINNEHTLTLSEEPFRTEVDTVNEEDGLLLIVAKGHDEEGNVDISTAEICVDNNEPLIEILSPADGDTVYLEDTKMEVLVHASDAVGIARITAEVQLSGGSQIVECDPVTGPDATCTLHPAELALSFAPQQREQAPLTVTVTDTAGHQTQREMSLDWTTRLIWTRDFNESAGQGITHAVALIQNSWNLVVATATADSLDGAVRVLDPGGEELCHFSTIVNSPPVVSTDGTQIFFTSDTALIAIDSSSCAQLWHKPGAFLFSRPVQRGGALFIGRNGQSEGTPTPAQLAAYAVKDGAPLGAVPISAHNGDLAPAWPALSADGKSIYIGSIDGNLYSFNVTAPAKMTKQWTYLTGGAVLTRALDLSDRLYLPGFDAVIHAIDPATGKRIESFSFQANAFRTDVATSPDQEILYASCTDRYLYALDRRGQVLAQREVGRTVSRESHPYTTHYSTPVIGPGGTVLQACTTAKKDSPCGLNALSPERLEPLWFWDAEPDPVYGMTFLATPTLADNVLYIGSFKGVLYALDVSRSTTN